VAALVAEQKSADHSGALLRFVHVGIAVLAGERFCMADAKQRWRSLPSPSCRRDHGRRYRQ
jgi:hypothetical protein